MTFKQYGEDITELEPTNSKSWSFLNFRWYIQFVPSVILEDLGPTPWINILHFLTTPSDITCLDPFKMFHIGSWKYHFEFKSMLSARGECILLKVHLKGWWLDGETPFLPNNISERSKVLISLRRNWNLVSKILVEEERKHNGQKYTHAKVSLLKEQL